MKRFTFGLVALACTSCVHQTPQNSSAKLEDPVIVRIVGRTETITARAGADGVVYSVSNSQGEQIIPGMTLQQMQAQHPDLARKLRTFQADASNSSVGWAGM